MKNEKELLQECKIQLEYLNDKFGETGTTNALLTKLDAVLRQPDVIKSVCRDCLYYLTCNNESRDKQICNNYDNEP